MSANEEKINRLFINWLSISLVLVFFIIIVGGLTRLTNSGLSITEWELFEGVLPPLSDESWLLYFEQYKKIPQYKLLNNTMQLEEFKIIFYWEYFHRFIARLIGVFFLIPLIYFYFSKVIKKEYIKTCLIIFLLILFQGIIGWYMVQSGLVNDVTVSHYRLSLHLSIAILIISMIFWLIKNTLAKKNKLFFKISYENIPFQMLIFLIFVQIIIGAFVSGLDAGKIYQTWPLMGESFLPNDITLINFENLMQLDNHSLVQFYHRNFAYLIIIYVFFLSVYIFKRKIFSSYKSLAFLIIILILQAMLGIFTLVSGLNIYLASAHQVTGVLLVFSALNLYYLRTK
jgi:cytochrome c oxidase assembly protein subunit 15